MHRKPGVEGRAGLGHRILQPIRVASVRPEKENSPRRSEVAFAGSSQKDTSRRAPRSTDDQVSSWHKYRLGPYPFYTIVCSFLHPGSGDKCRSHFHFHFHN